jgi:hypothetical protein
MTMDRKILLKNLLLFVEPYYLSLELKVDPKTIRNWVLGFTPCPEYAIVYARKLITNRFAAFTAHDYQSYAYDGDRVVARLRSSSTYIDKDKLLYYFYKNIENIEKIIFFARTPSVDELSEYIFGCVIETKSEALVCDSSSMTACRRPRELEIIELFRNMILNDFIDVMFFNSKILPVLEDQPVNQSYKLINVPGLVKISKNSIKDYLPLISGVGESINQFKLNEEEYFDFKDDFSLRELESPIFQET